DEDQQAAHASEHMSALWAHGGSKENAPSRWRLRPAFRLTAAEATTTWRAINLGRSVLGACTTLVSDSWCVKTSPERTLRNLRCFLFKRVRLQNLAHDLAPPRKEKGPAPRPT